MDDLLDSSDSCCFFGIRYSESLLNKLFKFVVILIRFAGILIGLYGIDSSNSNSPRNPLDVKLVIDEVTADKISSNLRSV